MSDEDDHSVIVISDNESIYSPPKKKGKREICESDSDELNTTTPDNDDIDLIVISDGESPLKKNKW